MVFGALFSDCRNGWKLVFSENYYYIIENIETNSSQILKNSTRHALIFGIGSDRNKWKRGSEMRVLLMPWGAEVGEKN